MDGRANTRPVLMTDDGHEEGGRRCYKDPLWDEMRVLCMDRHISTPRVALASNSGGMSIGGGCSKCEPFWAQPQFKSSPAPFQLGPI